MEHEVIYCTRDEFESAFHHRPSDDMIGICFVSPDGRTIVREYIFVGELHSWKSAQVSELERLYSL